jgi:alkylresorcinol/alkylpyrone synthase
MAIIHAVGTAVPPYLMTQPAAKSIAREHFSGKIEALPKYLRVFDNALVAQRHFCVPPAWFQNTYSLEEKNHAYLEWALRLSIEAILDCLDQSDTVPEEIDHIVFVSSSGIATPSLDVAIINALGLRRDVRRIPLFGLGCAGGAAGLALCGELARASPGGCFLLVAVELNSLTFQPSDFSAENVVATSLFGDGAAAVLIKGADRGGGCLRIVKSTTLLRAKSTGLMGWDFVDTGFRVVFSRDVPDVIGRLMPEALRPLLSGGRTTIDDISSFVLHPGGKKILHAYEHFFARTKDSFTQSYDVLLRYGNMSSATVLFVLKEAIRARTHAASALALLGAFGPGFSAELSLLQWL